MKTKKFYIILIIILFLGFLITSFFRNKKENVTIEDIFFTKKEAEIDKIEAVFFCDDNKKIEAIFYNKEEGGTVELKIDGEDFSLQQTISASGARYANEDETFVFWNKGNMAFIETADNLIYKNCQTVEEQ